MFQNQFDKSDVINSIKEISDKIIEENDKETLMGVLTHNHVKSYTPMFDKVDFV